MRFHLDEHVPHAVAKGLRLRGLDVTTTSDAGLVSAEDEDHIAYALAENRVIFTQDADFLVLASRADVDHAGIVYCHQGTRSIGDIIHFLVLVDTCMTEDEMKNHVEFVA